MIDIKNATVHGDNLGYDSDTNDADFSIRAHDGTVYKFSMNELDFSEFVTKVAALHRQIQQAALDVNVGPPVTVINADDAWAQAGRPANIRIVVQPMLGPLAAYALDVDDAEKLALQILDLVPPTRDTLAKLSN